MYICLLARLCVCEQERRGAFDLVQKGLVWLAGGVLVLCK